MQWAERQSRALEALDNKEASKQEKKESEVEKPSHEKREKTPETREKVRSTFNFEDRSQKALDAIKNGEREEREQENKETKEKTREGALGNEEREPEDFGEIHSKPIEEAYDDALEEIQNIEDESKLEKTETKETVNQEHHAIGEMTPQEMAEIRTKEDFEQTPQHHPDLELCKTHDAQYKEVEDYFDTLERNENPDKPTLIEKLENLELRDMYVTVHGKLPEVPIESIEDVDKLLEKNPEHREQPKFSESYRHSKVYFDVRDDWSKTEKELATEHNVSESSIGNYRRREIEPRLISSLRVTEEDHIIKEWANSHRLDEDAITKLKLSKYTEMGNETKASIDRPTAKSIESKVVNDSIKPIRETNNPGKEEVVKSIENMIHNAPEEARVFVADLQNSDLDIKKLSDIEKTIQQSRKEIQESLKERLENVDDVRVGFVKDKLYVWTPESNQNDMINAWNNQYFYFNHRELSDLVDRTGTQLSLGETKFEKYENLSELSRQMTQSSNPLKIKNDSSRIIGEALQFQRDTLGLRTKDFEGKVSKVAGANGVGGIDNPRLLEGEKLEAERARLFSIIKSDGWVSHDGKVGYVEKDLERFNIVEKDLQSWGDFNLSRYFDNTQRAHETKLPSPFWEALTFWGFSPGDKLMHNEGLPFDIDKLSPESIKAYHGELTPEDGNFHPSRGFSWSRSVAIDAGTKVNDYDFKSLITPELKEFIQDNAHDTKGPRGVPRKELPIKELRDIIDTPTSKESDRTRAEALMHAINENPSKLLEDEAKMARRMSINVETNPREIRYYPETGRITVYWEGRTCSNEDAEKWGILFSSNDIRKRSQVKRWLIKRGIDLEKTKQNLDSKEISYEEWWS